MNDSFSLLTQKEIDTLVNFLSNHDFVSNEVLSQDSIDKLIHLVQHNDITASILDNVGLKTPTKSDILQEIGLRENSFDICELCCSIDKDTNYIVLTGKNTVTGKEKSITPSVVDRCELIGIASNWGYCIAPVLFNKIARIFSLKYSRQTYEFVCKLFAEKNFSSMEVTIPSFYCPTNNQLLDNLL